MLLGNSSYIYYHSYNLYIPYFQDNLCGQRGLLPSSDTQTFQMALPRRLRNQYDKILKPLQVYYMLLTKTADQATKCSFMYMIIINRRKLINPRHKEQKVTNRYNHTSGNK